MKAGVCRSKQMNQETPLVKPVQLPAALSGTGSKRLHMPLAAGFLLLLLATVTQATTIAGMPIDSIVNDAELVFEGRVLSHLAERESGTGIINTYVTFQVIDVISGEYDAGQLELKFTGGEYLGEMVKVTGLRIPSVDEEGIYFVESMSRKLINPLLGWSQGHYVISEQGGVRRVNTAADMPVTDILPMSGVPTAIMRPLDLLDGDRETAAGIMTGDPATGAEEALTVEQFKTRIIELLEER